MSLHKKEEEEKKLKEKGMVCLFHSLNLEHFFINGQH